MKQFGSALHASHQRLSRRCSSRCVCPDSAYPALRLIRLDTVFTCYRTNGFTCKVSIIDVNNELVRIRMPLPSRLDFIPKHNRSVCLYPAYPSIDSVHACIKCEIHLADGYSPSVVIFVNLKNIIIGVAAIRQFIPLYLHYLARFHMPLRVSEQHANGHAFIDVYSWRRIRQPESI